MKHVFMNIHMSYVTAQLHVTPRVAIVTVETARLERDGHLFD